MRGETLRWGGFREPLKVDPGKRQKKVFFIVLWAIQWFAAGFCEHKGVMAPERGEKLGSIEGCGGGCLGFISKKYHLCEALARTMREALGNGSRMVRAMVRDIRGAIVGVGGV
jgi:hypothetical protein